MPKQCWGHGTQVVLVLVLSYFSVWGLHFSVTHGSLGGSGVPVGAPKPTALSLPADLSPMDGISTCSPKEEATLRVVVRMPPQHIIRGVRAAGSVALSPP